MQTSPFRAAMVSAIVRCDIHGGIPVRPSLSDPVLPALLFVVLLFLLAWSLRGGGLDDHPGLPAVRVRPDRTAGGVERLLRSAAPT